MLSKDSFTSRGPLFDGPGSRRSDPQTSDMAGQKLKRSGHWRGQKRNVFEVLRKHPGSTSAELAEIMGVDRYMTARRLPDLERAGMVKRGRIRACTMTKSCCITWWPNPDYDGPLLYEPASER